MRKRIFAIVLAIALVGMLGGCNSTQQGESNGNTAPVVNQDPNWTMRAAWVNDRGEVLEELELTVEGKTWADAEGHEFCQLGFWYPEDVYNSVSGPMPSTDDRICNCLTGAAQERGSDAGPAKSFYIGWDVARNCFLLDMDDGEDRYLIAYADPADDLAKIWTHFQSFMEQIPAEFPTTSAG